MNAIDEVLTRGVANIIPGKKELFGKLASRKKLNVYLGIDPTSTKIHLGHAVALRKLNELAKLGHNVTFLIGDFTALIGDTSDKDSERPALTIKEIEENFKTYKKQAEKILDFSKVKVKYNSQWLKKLSFEDIVKLCQHFSVGDFAGRELIRKRLNENKRVGLHEFLYPVMQGYDSFFMDTDLQIGGTDQTFNMQAGRTLIKNLRKKESFVLSIPILEGSDGKKMSKSWGNAIWLEDPAIDMYGKIMAISDDFILNYFLMSTNLSVSEIKKYEERLGKKENPINIKKDLAFEIVKELHNEKSAKESQKEFEKTVQGKEISGNIPLVAGKWGPGKIYLVDVLLKGNLAESKSDAKRLFVQGGVSIDGKIVKEFNIILEDNSEHILKVGPRKAVKLVVK